VTAGPTKSVRDHEGEVRRARPRQESRPRAPDAIPHAGAWSLAAESERPHLVGPGSEVLRARLMLSLQRSCGNAAVQWALGGTATAGRERVVVARQAVDGAEPAEEELADYIDNFPGWSVAGGRGTAEDYQKLASSVPASARSFYASKLFVDWYFHGAAAILAYPDPETALRQLALNFLPDPARRAELLEELWPGGDGSTPAAGPNGGHSGGTAPPRSLDQTLAPGDLSDAELGQEIDRLREYLPALVLNDATRERLGRALQDLLAETRQRYALAAATTTGDYAGTDVGWVARGRRLTKGLFDIRGFDRFIHQGHEISPSQANKLGRKLASTEKGAYFYDPGGRFIVQPRVLTFTSGASVLVENWLLMPDDPKRAKTVMAYFRGQEVGGWTDAPGGLQGGLKGGLRGGLKGSRSGFGKGPRTKLVRPASRPTLPATPKEPGGVTPAPRPRWDDAAMTEDQAVSHYREAGVRAPLSEAKVRAKFRAGYRFDPVARRWKKPFRTRQSGSGPNRAWVEQEAGRVQEAVVTSITGWPKNNTRFKTAHGEFIPDYLVRPDPAKPGGWTTTSDPAQAAFVADSKYRDHRRITLTRQIKGFVELASRTSPPSGQRFLLLVTNSSATVSPSVTKWAAKRGVTVRQVVQHRSP
jgi:hypothetical protein